MSWHGALGALVTRVRSKRQLKEPAEGQGEEDASSVMHTRLQQEQELHRKRVANTFVPVACSIFGVVIFLRLGVVVGTLGVAHTLLVIVLAFVITFLTVGSISALASTYESAHPGGLFHSLRRSLGQRLGNIVGIMLHLSFGVSTAYYLLGFAEIALYYFGLDVNAPKLPWNESGSWLHIACASALLGLFAVLYARGVTMTRRVLRFVLVMVMVAVTCNAVILLLVRSDSTGHSSQRLEENWKRDPNGQLVEMFGTFFPAFCGVVAGAHLAESVPTTSNSISLQYQNTRSPIQLILGVHKALGFTLFVYVLLGLVLAASVDNHALRHDYFIAENVVDSFLGVPLVFLGIACATLSSAFTNLVGATSILTTVLSSNDDDLEFSETSPLNGIMGKRRSRPSWPTLLWTCVLCECAIFCGSVNSIIPIVSAVFLLTFVIINFACLLQEVSSPSFFPSFRLYSKWTAFLGCILSLGAFILVVSWIFLYIVGALAVAYVTWCRDELSEFANQIAAAQSASRMERERKVGYRLQLSPSASGAYISLMDYSDSEDEDQHESKRFELAALYVRDAVNGRFLGEEYLIEGIQKTLYRRTYHALQYGRLANMTVLMMLTFFETPSWCILEPTCGDRREILTWNLPMLSKNVASFIELTCLSILAAEMMMKYTYMGQRLYFVNKWHLMQIILLLAEFVAVLVVLCAPPNKVNSDNTEGDSLSPPVLSPIIRPVLLLTTSRRLRAAFTSLARAIPHFADGLLTLTALIVVYAVCGMVLFEGTNEGSQYFSNFADSCMSLLILLTTANYPDVMMPIYSEVRAASLFFVSFLVIGQLLVINLVFASVYQNYRQEAAQRATKYEFKRQQALRTAFQLLPPFDYGNGKKQNRGEKVITKATYDRLVAEITRPTLSIFHESNRRSTNLRGNAVDTAEADSEAAISFADFVRMIQLFDSRKKNPIRHRARATTQADTSRFAIVDLLRRAVLNGKFDRMADILIFGNLVIISIEIQARIDDNGNPNSHSYMAWELYMPLFSCVYLAEMLLKMYSYGIGPYFYQAKNVYDCVVTIVISIAEVSIHAHYGNNVSWEWARVLLLLRFLRCLRLLVALRAINSMFAIVVRLLPSFSALYGMLGIIVVEYAVVGMHIFGGKIIKGDAALAKIDFGKSNYYSNNFNDFASSLVTLFELLIVNNWYVTMEGAVAVTSKWSRLYFASFYIIGVVMVLSLVVAFIVEAYFDQVAIEHNGKPKAAAEVRRGPFSPPFSPAFGDVNWPTNASSTSSNQSNTHQRRRVPNAI